MSTPQCTSSTVRYVKRWHLERVRGRCVWMPWTVPRARHRWICGCSPEREPVAFATMPEAVEIGAPITLDDVERVALGAPVTLGDGARGRIRAARNVIERAVAEGST